jgi:hypothetical protein
MSWTVVFSSLQPHIVEIVKSILSDNDIQCVTMDKRDSMYNAVNEPGIEVYIHGDDFIRAKKLLSEIGFE